VAAGALLPVGRCCSFRRPCRGGRSSVTAFFWPGPLYAIGLLTRAEVNSKAGSSSRRLAGLTDAGLRHAAAGQRIDFARPTPRATAGELWPALSWAAVAC
jgi:hypothetical protein